MRKLTEENEKETKPKKIRVKKVSEKIPENTGQETYTAQDKKDTTQIPLVGITDKTKEQETVKPKQDNAWIWALVALAVAALIAYLINFRNEKTN